MIKAQKNRASDRESGDLRRPHELTLFPTLAPEPGAYGIAEHRKYDAHCTLQRRPNAPMLALQPRVHAPIVIETLLFAGIGWQREQTQRAGEEGREVYRSLGVGQRCFRVTQIQNQISAMFVHVMRAHQRFPRFIISCCVRCSLRQSERRRASKAR
jgi:hypothetical protein